MKKLMKRVVEKGSDLGCRLYVRASTELRRFRTEKDGATWIEIAFAILVALLIGSTIWAFVNTNLPDKLQAFWDKLWKYLLG